MDKVNNIMGGNVIEKLKEHAAITQAVYDDYWRYVRNNGDPINWNVMASLANRANLAANDVTEEEEFALNGCQHKTVSYQGSMHFSAGEVDDDIVEVCEDCGYLFSGTEEGGE